MSNRHLPKSLSNSLRQSGGGAAGDFVNYLPQDEAVAVGRGADPVESQRVVDLLNRELSRLLKFNPKDFWREVSSNASLHDFLESYLKFRSRWYDFPYRGTSGMVAGVIIGEFDLSRRVFMVLYRISSCRDPGARAADSLNPRDHSAILQEKKLLDLPKLLDVCAIYARDNEDPTRLLVENAIKAQPWIHDNLTAVVSQFLSIVHTMYQRCNSSLEVLFSSADEHGQGFSHQYSDYLEVMDFINDAAVSMDGFVGAYKHAAVFFCSHVEMSNGHEEVLKTLSRLHDSLVPSLRRAFQIIHTSGKDGVTDDMLSNIAISLKMLSTRIVNFGWKLLYTCYLSDEVYEWNSPLPPAMKMFPANVEDPVIRADILIQSFRDISGDALEGRNHSTFLQNMEKTNKIMSRVQILQKAGWMSMDSEQIQYLSRILKPSLEDTVKEAPHNSSSGTGTMFQADEDAVFTESKISQVKDLFPEYGKGYISACLEVYNQNPEEVIQRILEGTLHKELLSLDVSLESIPQNRSVPSFPANDKGKGKLTEETVPSRKIPPPANIHQVGGSSNSSSGGRYMRKGRTDLPDSETLDSRSGSDLAKTASLALQLEYEDEYDDSFDDLGMGVGDSGFDEAETAGDSSTSHRSKQQGTSAGSETRDPTNTKWGSRKAPQFYVKDGKNYSYKVAGSVGVANYNEASLINQVQKGQIHGLGRGGNIPLGAERRISEYIEGKGDASDMNGGGGQPRTGNFRGGRGGRRGGRGYSISGSTEEQDDPSKMKEGEGPPGTGNFRGGRGGRIGRNHSISGSNVEQDGPSEMKEGEGQPGPGSFRGSRGGGRGGRNHNRKDRALKKHFSGISGV
ncbi:hypothetical protein LIER_20443 [Lithospermum erythrorhizon]|uniref:CUE domain-containing protein n=1 Tax=Lithospermum erythrorhizon TaxID=34254 RepID=A0AAV3QQL3_LITER